MATTPKKSTSKDYIDYTQSIYCDPKLLIEITKYFFDTVHEYGEMITRMKKHMRKHVKNMQLPRMD